MEHGDTVTDERKCNAGNQVLRVQNIVKMSCVVLRQAVPDPGGSFHGSQLSIISWHLNLLLTLTLTQPYTKLLVPKKRKTDRQITNRLHTDAILHAMPQAIAVTHASQSLWLPVHGSRGSGAGCQGTIHYVVKTLWIWWIQSCFLDHGKIGNENIIFTCW